MPAIETLLPADPRSAGRARRFVAAALHTAGHERHTDTTELLVSELVTNALLHSRSDIGVRVVPAARTVRVEVRDASPVLPTVRSFAPDAATGRGLELVELLSSRWGAERVAPGKVVWFEVGEAPSGRVDEPTGGVAGRPAPSAEAEPTEGAEGADARTSEGRQVQLLGVPVALYRAMQQHNAALLREFTLRALGARATSDALPVSATAQDAVGDVEAGLQAASDAGESTVDLTAQIAARAGEASRQLLAALDEADELSRSGELLTPPTLPEIRGCRHWWLGEVVAQLDGAAPTPWSHFDVEQPEITAPLAPVAHRDMLDQLNDAIVVGDDRNRIVHLNPAGERLLGWPAGELVGRRLTVIIPERLRDAHVVGYTNFLVTGTPRLIGRPVRVPARRRDGTEVAVELLLSAFRGPDGRRAFVGSLRDMTDRPEADRQGLMNRGLWALEELAVAVSSPTAPRGGPELATLTMQTVARHLAWRFAAAWTPDPGHREPDGSPRWLRCVEIYEDQSGAYPDFAATTRQQRLRRGAGLPGRVWESGQPAWINVVADANFPRASAALRSGLRSGLAFPLRRAPDARVDAVAEFFTDRALEPDDGLLAVVNAIGVVVGAATR